jgi:hypothetical protein
MLGVVLAAAIVALSGDVRTSDGTPVAGARVVCNGSQSATTGTDGHFVIVPLSVWPDDLAVSAGGYGTEIVPVPRVHQSAMLKPIVLRRGAVVHVHLLRGRGQRAVEIKVGIDRDDERPRWIARRHIGPSAGEVTFSDLAQGTYLILVSGPGRLQRAAARAIVATADVRDVNVDLPARNVRARVIRNGDPLKNTEVLFTNVDHQWEGTVITDSKGRIDQAVWDCGGFEARIRRLPGALPVMRFVTLRAGRLTTIEMPPRSIRGTVADSRGAPIPGAILAFRTHVETGRAMLRLSADARGGFVVDGVDGGPQEVRAIAPGYLFGGWTSVSGDNVTITLNQGYPRELLVTSDDRTPIASAEVLCVVDGQVRARARTGFDGVVVIPTPSDAGSSIYIIPIEGSLAVQRLEMPMDETSNERLSIRVPGATASLHIQALTTAGTPISDLGLLLRLNGELIPLTVVHELERLQGLQLRTAANGAVTLEHLPTGVYELWPYQGEDELADLIDSTNLGTAPVAVNVLGGRNDVTVRLQTK